MTSRRADLAIRPSDDYPPEVKTALRAGGFYERKYQRYAVYEALQLLRKGKNVEIVLPPGTGKTLIAQIIACCWLLEIKPANRRVLFLLPSRVLRAQHFETCYLWANSLCQPLEVSGEWLGDKHPWHALMIEQHRCYFALPRSLNRGLTKGNFPLACWNEIDLVICDEYDAFSVGILSEEGFSQERLNKNLAELVPHLENPPKRFLLMSATPLTQSSLQVTSLP